jgi:hypothetical protein
VVLALTSAEVLWSSSSRRAKRDKGTFRERDVSSRLSVKK